MRPWGRRLWIEIDKLARVDAAGSWALRSIYLTAMGNASEAREAVRNAVRLDVSPDIQGSLATNVYINFANFSDALDLLTKAADPSRFPLDVSPAEAATIAIEASARLADLPFSSSAATLGFRVYRPQARSEPVVA